MALSPVLIKSVVPIFEHVHGGSFTVQQVQTVLLTDAVTNESTWAVALHSALGRPHGVESAIKQASALLVWSGTMTELTQCPGTTLVRFRQR